jgi:hypothetical protein
MSEKRKFYYHTSNLNIDKLFQSLQKDKIFVNEFPKTRPKNYKIWLREFVKANHQGCKI